MNIDKKLVGNRIKSLRLENKLTQENLALLLGLNNKSSISQYENGSIIPSDKIKLKLCDIFNCPMEYLMGVSNTRYEFDYDNWEKKVNENSKEENLFYMCPVYGQISAGLPNWAEECIEGRLPLDTDLMGIVNPEEHFFLRVNGESMNKIIKNGAFALIHKQDTIENGEIAVVLVNGFDATLKKFTKQGDLVILEPQSSDDTFKTQVYDKTTNIKILGKYIGKMEINK